MFAVTRRAMALVVDKRQQFSCMMHHIMRKNFFVSQNNNRHMAIIAPNRAQGLMHCFLSIICLVVLSACVAGGGTREYSMFDGPPDGQVHSGLYLQGWRDGCETGVASSADNVYRYSRLFRQNWQLAQNDIYHKGWRDAYDFCRKRVLYEQQ